MNNSDSFFKKANLYDHETCSGCQNCDMLASMLWATRNNLCMSSWSSTQVSFVLLLVVGVLADDTVLMVAITPEQRPLNTTKTGRGETWCELNPVKPPKAENLAGYLIRKNVFGEKIDLWEIAIFACQQGAPGQEQNCCPYEKWDAITSPRDETSIAYSYIKTNYFKPVKLIYNGAKKKLWDELKNPFTFKKCAVYEADHKRKEFSVSNIRICDDDKTNCMNFLYENHAVIPSTSIDAFTTAITVDMYPPKGFFAGKKQPIMTDDKGNRYALQSYKIYDYDDPNSAEKKCTISDCSSKPGEEKNMCSYLDSRALDGLPKGWAVTCGVLKEDVWCGLETCTDQKVITDNAQLGTLTLHPPPFTLIFTLTLHQVPGVSSTSVRTAQPLTCVTASRSLQTFRNRVTPAWAVVTRPRLLRICFLWRLLSR